MGTIIKAVCEAFNESIEFEHKSSHEIEIKNKMNENELLEFIVTKILIDSKTWVQDETYKIKLYYREVMFFEFEFEFNGCYASFEGVNKFSINTKLFNKKTNFTEIIKLIDLLNKNKEF